MVTFRNNSKRNNFRRNDRVFKSSAERPKFNNSFNNNENFKRKNPNRNNHNAAKLIEKYNNLAREALSSGDKILSENYYQHADHFLRIINDQQIIKKDNQISNDNKIKIITNDNSEENLNDSSEKDKSDK
ncbi:DUF4167 domain-containing protein [Candidatus Pelagibacter sp.]|uniref:DUF4167 domain-containing protein n=1 Tax=Candidatus Pelagibacter sp. TaxID=2024849 RepID=UPI003F82A49B